MGPAGGAASGAPEQAPPAPGSDPVSSGPVSLGKPPHDSGTHALGAAAVGAREPAVLDLSRVALGRFDDLVDAVARHVDGDPPLRAWASGDARTQRELAALRDLLREGLVAGSLAGHEPLLHAAVVDGARAGVDFPAWQGVLGAARRVVNRALVQSLPEPARLAAALVVLDRAHDRHTALVVEALLAASIPPEPESTPTLDEPTSRYRDLFDAIALPTYVYDPQTVAILDVNRAAAAKFGFERDDFIGRSIAEISMPEYRAGNRGSVGRLPDGLSVTACELVRRDGSTFFADVYGTAFRFGSRRARLALVIDTSQHRLTTAALRASEDQLRHAQKMEAIGRLAGGVAHDFNNLLSVILGYADMLIADLAVGVPMRADMGEIRLAAQRGADLCRQLLLFSRHRGVEPTVLDLDDLLGGMEKMFHRVLGAEIQLVSMAGRALGRIRADRGHIEQVVMNLVVNARDAMPKGGKLTLETANVVLGDDAAGAHHGAPPGRYVTLTVTDTGTGMDRQTLAHVFEPFFTTKERGKGTGLGLAIVFGIVQQSGGTVWLESEVGKGTVVKVYLPRVDDAVGYVPSLTPSPTLRGVETVLLVEDDDQVRGVVRGILRRSGYNVLEAANAGEAILQSEKYTSTIHLLLTDVVMPQVSGPELAARLLGARPAMKVLCMSGYTEDSVLTQELVGTDMAYIQKPVTPDALAAKVRSVLDNPDAAARAREQGIE